MGEHGNAERVTSFLQRIWHEHPDAVLRDAEQRARYSGLVDRLVGRGVALATLEEATRAP